MNKLEKLKNNLAKIQDKIGIKFKNEELLILALVHSSFYNENKKTLPGHNERLEFLGDSALNLVVSDFLFKEMPKVSEGSLSHIRSLLVNANICAKYFDMLGLKEHLLLGKGEEKTEKRGKTNIFADGFEAFVGAIYLDRGFDVLKKFLLKNFKDTFEKNIFSPELDYKGKLQEYCQKKYKSIPVYEVIKEEGQEHQKTFYVAVLINNKEIAKGEGSSKKIAELEASKKAFEKLERNS